MIVMEVEGGSWVGDMFQKFETMCIEVEEAIYEDTFKYVENHVWTVGETVKRFYSDVMQDLIPPSPSDSMISEDPDSTVGHDEELINVKNGFSCLPNCSVIKPHKHTSNYSVEEKDEDSKSLSQVACLDISDRATSKTKDMECVKDSQESLSNLRENIRNHNDEEITLGICSSSETLLPLNEDGSSKEVREISRNEEVCVEIGRDLKKCDESGDLINTKKMRILPGRDLADDSDGHLLTDVGLTSTQANLNTNITNNVENTIEVDKELSMFDIEILNSFQSPNFGLREANEEGFLVEQPNEAKLEESCVLVRKNDIFSKQGRHIRRSYKKKIQDVFSSRRWSKGKYNQEQIAVWYEEQCGKNSVCTTLNESQLQKPQTIMSFDSDWELL